MNKLIVVYIYSASWRKLARNGEEFTGWNGLNDNGLNHIANTIYYGSQKSGICIENNFLLYSFLSSISAVHDAVFDVSLEFMHVFFH